MFGEVVEGIDGHRFEDALDALKRERGVALDTDLTAEDLDELVETYRAIYREAKGERVPAGRARAAAARRRAPSSTRGTRRARGSTAGRTRSRTTSAPRSTSCRWCSATRATARARASRSRATRRPARAARRASSSRTRRARTSSRGSARRSRSRRWATCCPGAYEQLLETLRAARAALPRRAGRRVHGRGRPALHAADARGEAHGARPR